MPKVTEDYIEEKRNQIMDTAFEIMKEIPLYEITMRDIIKKVGCSQGLIYRYYKSVDEIYVDLMNREIAEIEFQDVITAILNSERSADQIIKKAFHELGIYIVNVQRKVGGKFYYEIQVGYLFDNLKREELLPQLLIKQNMIFFQTQIIQFIVKNIGKGVFTPTIAIDTLATYTGVVIEGIGNNMAVVGKGASKEVEEQSLLLFDMLSNYITNCLGIGGECYVERK